MVFTSAKLGKKLGIKRNSVVMRMNKIPNFRQKYTQRKGHVLIINSQGAKLIAEEGNGKKESTVKSQSEKNSNSQKSIKKVQITDDTKILKELLHKEEANHRQNRKSMQKVIDSYQKSQGHLEKLLDQQQQLQLATQKENNELKGYVGHLKESLKKRPRLTKKSPSKPKLGFWRRLFGVK